MFKIIKILILILARRHCSDTEHQCKNNICIPQSFLCDDRDDCLDGVDGKSSSDELLSECGRKEFTKLFFQPYPLLCLLRDKLGM